MIDQIIEFLKEAVKPGVMAAFGGIAHYLYGLSKSDDSVFSRKEFVINIVLAFFIGSLLDDWIPADLTGRGGIIMASGFLAYPLLDILENHGMEIIKRKIKVKNGNDKQ